LTISIESSYTGQVCAAHKSDQSELGNPKSKKPTFRAPKHSKLETVEKLETRELTETFT
jgi:hypothetical protein